MYVFVQVIAMPPNCPQAMSDRGRLLVVSEQKHKLSSPQFLRAIPVCRCDVERETRKYKKYMDLLE